MSRRGMTYVEMTSEGKVPHNQLRTQRLLRLLGENCDSEILREVAFCLYHLRRGVWLQTKAGTDFEKVLQAGAIQLHYSEMPPSR